MMSPLGTSFLALLALTVVSICGAAAVPSQKYSVGKKNLAATGTIELLGRWDGDRAEWSGTGIQMHVVPPEGSPTTTIITVNYLNCTESCKYFIETLIDGVSLMTTEISETTNQFVLTSMVLPPEGSTFQFIKRTEPWCADAVGVMKVGDITVTGGSLLTTNSAKKSSKAALRGSTSSTRRILFIGDSITAAYGSDGTDPCVFTAATENMEHSYANLVAQQLEAEAHFVAWSGIGVVRNYGDPNQVSTTPMPTRYNRTIATEEGSYWNPQGFTPDVVHVMLGTNDYSTFPQPTDDQFQSGYTAFLTQIRADYPSAKIMIACAPMKNENQSRNIAAVAKTNENIVSAYLDIPSSTMTTAGSNGCSGHPSIQGHINIAAVVAPALEQLLPSSKMQI
jgi:lysophospholipase L1-like esterase